MKRVRQREVNEQLQKLGFGGLDDPELFKQMAMCIGYTEPTLAGKHEHFRKFLLAVEPEHRVTAYEMIRPHLIFPAKALDQYISDGKREAEELQLPVRMPDGSMVSYKDYHGGTTEGPTLEMMAQGAIALASQRKPRAHRGEAALAQIRETEAQFSATEKALFLTCAKCTRTKRFEAIDSIGGYAAASKAGWAFDKRGDEEIAICPKCPAVRVPTYMQRLARA